MSMQDAQKLQSQTVGSIDAITDDDPEITPSQQDVIKRLFQRKEFWKRTAYTLQHHANQAKTWQTKAVTYRKKYTKEREMKTWWKTVALVTGVSSIITLVFLLALSLVASKPEPSEMRMPASGRLTETPNSVLSSVILFNGDTQGSGTVISRGEKYAAILSNAHNFEGNIGQKHWVYFADGTYTEAKLIAYDKKRDLAVSQVDQETVLGHSYVPDKMEPGPITSVGYGEAQGPTFQKVSYKSSLRENENILWKFGSTNKAIRAGYSGGGVFQGDALIGVMSQRDVYSSKGKVFEQGLSRQESYAVSWYDIKEFLSKHETVLRECGDWRQQPQVLTADNQPPLWVPSPNVPVVARNNQYAILQRQIDELKTQRSNEDLLKRPSEVSK